MVLRLPDSWLNWNLEMLVFEEKGKQEYPEKNLSKQRREPTANSTHRWRRTKYQTLVFLTKVCSNYFNQSMRFTPQDPTFTVLCTHNGFLSLTAPLGEKFFFLSSLQRVASLRCFGNAPLHSTWIH